jgi:hypothetical protein
VFSESAQRKERILGSIDREIGEAGLTDFAMKRPMLRGDSEKGAVATPVVARLLKRMSI